MTLCAIACALLFYAIADAEIPWKVQVFFMWGGAMGWALMMWIEPKDDETPAANPKGDGEV